ncbi:MAG TPA: hypothetical protein PLU22_13185 [Polyangiaceae bacterium]|nr:hypothetical protein [Polyangiaceae bacterium]
MADAAALLAEIAAEFPGFRVVYKRNSPLSRAIDGALRALTLGRQREYLTRYHTVIGRTLYLPDAWASTSEIARVIVLRHERVHLHQFRRYGLLGMAALYLLPLFPVGLAWGRARLEWEAYRETLAATAELRGLAAAQSPALREEIVDRFVSGAYGWMWPFRRTVERWYDDVIRELEARTDPSSRRPPRRHRDSEEA